MSARTDETPTLVLEERRRVARELHDGVIQEVVALLYRVDEVVAASAAGPTRDAVVELRDDLARIVCEVRRSVEDLRGGPELDDGLAAALSAHAGELDRSGDPRVHLHLDARGVRPTPRVEREVLKIAAEAITNVRRHACAVNLWVRLVTYGDRLVLVVEDDGIGNVAHRPGHFGLQGMRERAERIGADLVIGVRQDGGTVVTLSSRTTDLPTREGDGHDRQDLARR